MKKREIIITRNNLVDESPVITEADYNEFMQAKTYGERMQVLLAHSQRNNDAIRQRRIKMEKTQEQIEQEMLELSRQFGEFLRERNIFQKFKIAFANMGESASRQHEQDKANLQAVKAMSAEENAEFAEFIHTKGFQAKCKLIFENIKNGAKNTPQRTEAQIARSRAQTQANITAANAHNPHAKPAETEAQVMSAESLVAAFNEFLKSKGLDGEYSVRIAD